MGVEVNKTCFMLEEEGGQLLRLLVLKYKKKTSLITRRSIPSQSGCQRRRRLHWQRRRGTASGNTRRSQ